MNTIILPIIDVNISGNGKCVDDSNSISSTYPLIEENNCALNQRFHSIEKRTIEDVLNPNDNYYNTLIKRLPLCSYLETDTKWSLDLEY